MVAPMTSSSVTWSREVIAWETGCEVNHDAPKSPWTAWDSQSPNWVSTGRSRPSSCVFCTTVASVASWPRMRRAMLPPAAWSRKNVAAVMTTIRTTPAASRLSTNRSTVLLGRWQGVEGQAGAML